MPTPEETAARARGHLDGEVAARLTAAEARLDAINGSVKSSTAAIEGLRLDVQKLDIEAVTREVTTLATAAALEAARKMRQESNEHAWSPVQRLLAIIVALMAVGSFSLMWLTYTALHVTHP